MREEKRAAGILRSAEGGSRNCLLIRSLSRFYSVRGQWRGRKQCMLWETGAVLSGSKKQHNCGQSGWTGARGSSIETNKTNSKTNVAMEGPSLRAIAKPSTFLNWGVSQ